ncbi:hypothetical protein AADZ90_021220 [Aestuariibius sp. 2305UL40-4]|uniref:hypothetical protein n=1 Tax=Aestuariibius violaceus TaxID=3234132 RepID=UPI00345E73A5
MRHWLARKLCPSTHRLIEVEDFVNDRQTVASDLIRGGDALARGWGCDPAILYNAAGILRDMRFRGVRTAGAAAIAGERSRQIDEEGWTAEHDDTHENGEMAKAAACYALGASQFTRLGQDPNAPVGRVTAFVSHIWPWPNDWWKPKSRRENLVRAGALIAAEIDRLDRQNGLTSTRKS